MRPSGRQKWSKLAGIQLALLLSLCIALLGHCLVGADVGTEESGEDGGASERIRRHFQLPEFFDFHRFKRAFEKHYAGLAEEVVRHKYFLARAFRAFVSAVAYKHMRRSSFLAVNSRSDWTKEELEATLMQVDGDQWARSPVAPPPQAEPGELAALLERIGESQEGGLMELADELRALGQPRSKRSVPSVASGGSAPSRRGFSVREALGRTRASGRGRAIGRGTKVRSNNPLYEAPELASFGAASNLRQHPDYKLVQYSWPTGGQRRPIVGEEGPLAKGGAFLAGVLSGFVEGADGFFGYDDHVEAERRRPSLAERQPADEIFVDHRKSGCFLEPQEQGECASCYAFAVLAYLEWAHCVETRTLVKFSEQYVLDCGPRVSGLNGCRGGKITSMAEFVQNFGLELERHYPYMGQQGQCAYDKNTPLLAMGYLRLQLDHVLRVPLDYMEHYLEQTPMVVSLALGADFHEYGGGVDEALGCATVGTHSMLLVGHGRQDGREYWLIRNSYSTDFGEQGYYKLDKLRGSRCFRPAEGFVYGRDGHSQGPPRLFAQRNSLVQRPVHALPVRRVGGAEEGELAHLEAAAASAREQARQVRKEPV